MKRILGMVVATAGVLAFSSTAMAAAVVFDLGGVVGGWSRSTDDAAYDPLTNGGPCGATGLSSTTPGLEVTQCFRYAFAPGSSISVDITGNAVTMLGGTLYIVNAVAPALSGTLTLTSNTVTTIYGATATTPAAIGTLVGNSILWSTPANVSTIGTMSCQGNELGSSCGLIGIEPPMEGVGLPYVAMYRAITNSTPVTALVLGEWQLDALHTTITGSTTAVSYWSNVAQNGNRRVGGSTFGPNLLGLPVPEPGAAALVLLGLGALALRSRKA